MSTYSPLLGNNDTKTEDEKNFINYLYELNLQDKLDDITYEITYTSNNVIIQ